MPTDLKIVKGKAVDVKLGKLRAEITELAKERGMDVDDEDYDLSDYMDEEFAEINVVETRATASSRDAPPLVEENAADEWQRAIQQRDEQISRLEKKVEEMMTAMITIQGQSQSQQMASPEVNQPEIVHITDERKEVASTNCSCHCLLLSVNVFGQMSC